MPTASPIIVIMSVIKKISSNTCPSSEVAPSATTMATMAKPIGISAATTAPKSTSIISSATGTPMLSPFEISASASSLDSAAILASPIVATLNPSLPFSLRTISRTSSTFVVASLSVPVMTIGMIVVFRSAETKDSIRVM